MDALVSLQTTRSSAVIWLVFWTGFWGGSDWLLRGGCDVWEEASLHLDFSTPQQSAVQITMAPLHVFIEDDLRR